MTVANPPEAPFDSEGSSLAPDNGSSKPTKLSSTRSLLSISYRELSRSKCVQGGAGHLLLLLFGRASEVGRRKNA